MNRQFLRKAASMMTLMALLAFPALAVNYGTPASTESALELYSGPGTDYAHLLTLPAGTEIVPLALESHDSESWVQVDFPYGETRARGYVSADSVYVPMSISMVTDSGMLRTLLDTAAVYAAPDMHAYTLAELPARTNVTFLSFDGAYCQIEYSHEGQKNRGYVREECFMVDLGAFAEGFPENTEDSYYAIAAQSPVFDEPNPDSVPLFTIPFDSSVTLDTDEFNAAPDGWLVIYYAGQRVFGRASDFSDLRFDSPEQAIEMLELMGEPHP